MRELLKTVWGHLFICSSSSHFFNKIDFKQYLFKISKIKYFVATTLQTFEKYKTFAAPSRDTLIQMTIGKCIEKRE